MILAVGSDKGAPGVTTLAAVLGLVWPSERVVTELDPRGADLPYRLALATGGPMAPSPSVVSLALASRQGATPESLGLYAQATVLGPVIAGELSAGANTRIAGQLPAVAAAAGSWPGTVIADVGGLHRENPAFVFATRAVGVVLLVRATVEGLGHLRERVDELAALVGSGGTVSAPLGVVVAAERREAVAAVERVGKLLASLGSTVPVLGVWEWNTKAAGELWEPKSSRALEKNPLVQSGRSLMESMLAAWPALVGWTWPSSAQAQAGVSMTTGGWQ
jgi:hypothetical protein